MSLQPKIFSVGSRYRVKSSFMSGTSTFLQDEILKFVMDSYSRYDDCFLYTFHSETNGDEKSWWLKFGDPASTWRDYFEPMND